MTQIVDFQLAQSAYLERKGIDLADLQAACPSAEISVKSATVKRYDSDGNEAEPWHGTAVYRPLLSLTSAEWVGNERILDERIKKRGDSKPNDKYVTYGATAGDSITPIGFTRSDLLSMKDYLVVCAGLADGFSLYESLGFPVACGVGEANIPNLVKLLRPLAGNATIVVAVDNDPAGHTAGNKSGAKWACPESLKDWSDVRQQQGLHAVREQFMLGLRDPEPEAETPPISIDAKQIARQINETVLSLLDLDKYTPQAAKVTADPVAIDGMINGAFWSGSASKVFMLTEQQALNRFTEKDTPKFLLKRFGKILDKAAVVECVEQLDLGGEPGSLADLERRRKLVKTVMTTPDSAITDHLKYHNQRDSIEWRVDMFATQSRLELLEDKARIVLTHKPFKEADNGYDQEVVDDYKQHFTRFDEFLTFLVMSRFALDRKKAYLWLLADSDWGKGFLIDGILGTLEAKVETSIKEIEAVFEGKPVGRSPEEFKRAFALVVDEFKTVKSEIKQLQSRLSLAPKFQLTSSVEIFAKVFMSAESVASLVTENGVEDQFANRMSIFIEKGTIESRPLFNSKGKPAYRAALVAYAAEFMNREIASMVKMGEAKAQDHAEKWLSGFIGRNGLDTVYERFSDSLERVALDAIEWLHRLPFSNDAMLRDVSSNTWHLKSARKMLDRFLEDTFDHSEVGAYRKRKDEILVHMSADGKGSTNHRINGMQKKTVMLKTTSVTAVTENLNTYDGWYEGLQ